MNLLRTRLRRSRREEMVAGVLGGIAEYFELDVGRVRLAYVAASILSAGFPGILLYILMWYVIPESEY